MWHALHDLLRGRLAASVHAPQINAAQALDASKKFFADAVSPDIAVVIHPKKLVDGELTVHVGHPALAQIVRQHEQGLLTTLKQQGHNIQRLQVLVVPTATEPSA